MNAIAAGAAACARTHGSSRGDGRLDRWSVGWITFCVLEHRPSELCISSITLAELRYGAEAHRSLAAALARRGEPIGTLDTLIAAHALSLRSTFATDNTRHFTRVPGLATGNWV